MSIELVPQIRVIIVTHDGPHRSVAIENLSSVQHSNEQGGSSQLRHGTQLIKQRFWFDKGYSAICTGFVADYQPDLP